LSLWAKERGQAARNMAAARKPARKDNGLRYIACSRKGEIEKEEYFRISKYRESSAGGQEEL
jgi:hypothetical protein